MLTNPPYGERMSTIEGANSWPAPWAASAGASLCRSVCDHC